jgi:hypothetical protein
VATSIGHATDPTARTSALNEPVRTGFSRFGLVIISRLEGVSHERMEQTSDRRLPDSANPWRFTRWR